MPKAIHRLSQSQLLLWAGQEMHPDSPLYNMIMTFKIQGVIDPDRFKSAFATLVEQTDVMRTVFFVEAGIPKQEVLPSISFDFDLIDLSGESESTYQTWLSERNERLLNLENRPWDAALIQRASDHWVWYLNPHHLIMDIWSTSVVYQRLAAIYHQQADEELSAMPTFGVYLDYEANSRKSISEASHSYWDTKRSQMLSPPILYGGSNPKQVSKTERRLLELGQERTESLRALAQSREFRSWTTELSLFHIFATLYATWLYRVSGQEQITFGTPIHNRRTQRFKQKPGMFIEVLPLMITIEEKDDFLTLFKRMQVEANQMFRHAHAGISSPELSRTFHAVLNFIHVQIPNFGDIPVRADWLHPNHADPAHHVRMHVMDLQDTGSLSLAFDLNCAVFPPAIREAIPHHFLNLLDAFLADYHQDIRQPSLLSHSEKKHTILAFNQTETSFPALSVLSLFLQQAAETPQAIALTDRVRRWSYAEVEEQSSRLAHALQDRGLQAGDIAALYVTRQPEFIMSILAIWKLGASYTPIPADLPSGRVQYLLEDADCQLVLTVERLLSSLTNISIPHVCIDQDWDHLMQSEAIEAKKDLDLASLAYVMYTSGSTGQPKGVMISHKALSNYVQWARASYEEDEPLFFPLFTMIGFDLTLMSLFVPVISGGQIVVYEEEQEGPDLALLQVIEDNLVTAIKLTPSHLSLIQGQDMRDSTIGCMIVGGEDFKYGLATHIYEAFGKNIRIYNEYGPTEATVGCILYQFDPSVVSSSVPIGRPAANLQAYVLDSHLNPVPQGVIGELYISGVGLADGYLNRPDWSEEHFVSHPFVDGARLYRTGDLARLSAHEQLDYLGRKDQQVKISGVRIELGEIEMFLKQHPIIQHAVVDIRALRKSKVDAPEQHCVQCGLPINYPDARYDEEGICHLCHTFESYQQKVAHYFRSMEDLDLLFSEIRGEHEGEYDCIMLLSGGKDSSFALAQLVEMGLRVLAFTLDNGYISEQAKANVRRVVSALDVDHVYGETDAMNAIFVDSLERHSNVCNGCFKTLYTLSTQLALQKRIPYIITGLSRGQFFETRLTEELFRGENIDPNRIDQIILDARKAYHRVDDAVTRLLDVSMFEDDQVFEQVKFLDFYRYCDVSLEEMFRFLDERLPWSRPTDTGRSTNCLINQLGIFVHKKDRGYHNYAFPYSWDVRIGHKTREEALDEINEEIDEREVEEIMAEIGYTPSFSQEGGETLTAWYVSSSRLRPEDLRSYLAEYLPAYMIPTHVIQIDEIPISPNGKVDRRSLTKSSGSTTEQARVFTAPQTEIEELLSPIWTEVLKIDRIGIHEDFLELGGNSLAAIRMMARINETFGLDLPLVAIFQQPSIAALGAHIEETILALMAEE